MTGIKSDIKKLNACIENKDYESRIKNVLSLSCNHYYKETDKIQIQLLWALANNTRCNDFEAYCGRLIAHLKRVEPRVRD